MLLVKSSMSVCNSIFKVFQEIEKLVIVKFCHNEYYLFSIIIYVYLVLHFVVFFLRKGHSYFDILSI